MLFALFGIGNDTLNLVVNVLVLSLVVVYFALVAWTFFDARRRMSDPVLVASSVGVSFVFPFIGTVIYSILRPPEFLEDAHEREVEIRAAELRVKHLTEQSCPKCDYPVEKAYLRCPNCRARLKDPCKECGQAVDPRWALCPYCETPIAKPERRTASRKAARPEREERPPKEPAPAKDAGRPKEPRRPREQRRPAAVQSRGSSKSGTRAAEAKRRTAGASDSRRSADAGRPERAEQREQKRETGPRSGNGKAGEERPRPATAS
jgi:Double zinc ribbon